MDSNKNIKINLKGDSMYFDKNIEINKEITQDITILHIKIYIKKLYKLPKDFEIYIYVIMPDLFCGFCPTLEQKIYDLNDLFGENNILNLKASDKPYFG